MVTASKEMLTKRLVPKPYCVSRVVFVVVDVLDDADHNNGTGPAELIHSRIIRTLPQQSLLNLSSPPTFERYGILGAPALLD